MECNIYTFVFINYYAKIKNGIKEKRGTGWRSGLRHCATSHKVAGSIPDGVTGVFH